MAGGRNNPDQNPDSEMTGLIGIVVFLIVVFAVYWLYKPAFVYAFAGLMWVQLSVLDLIGATGERSARALAVVYDIFAGRVDPWRVPFDVMKNVKFGVGERTKWFFAGGIALLACLIALKMKGNGYSRKFDLNALIRFQSLAWATTAVSAAFKPDTAPSELDPAMRPSDWVRAHKAWRKREGNEMGGLDTEVVKRLMEEQIGPPWRGLEPSHPTYVKALVVIMGLHHKNRMMTLNKGTPFAETIPVSLDLRGKISLIYSANLHNPRSKEVDAKVEALIAPFLADKKLMQSCENRMSKFGYLHTALVHLLIEARRAGGVLPTAEFLWLKHVDRTLWYGLNNAGRRAFHTEGAGIIAHYQAERVSGHALVEPHVGEAVIGVQTYFADQGIDQLDDIEDLFKVVED